MKTILKNLVIIFTVIVILLPIQVLAVPSLIDTGSECIETGNCNLCDLIDIFIRGSNIILYLSGIFAVVMFIYGGGVMITAYGNESRYKWGKDVIIAAIIGILIVTTAWTLVNTIIFSIYGSNSSAFGTIVGGNGTNLSEWSVCADRKIDIPN